MLVKYEKLVVLAPKKYTNSSTYAYDINWEEFLDLSPKVGLGVINIPSGISTPDPVDRKLCLLSSCLLKGVASTTICDKGYHLPMSCISAHLITHTKGFIEVENILFTSPQILMDTVLINLGTVIFRWCRFRSNRSGVAACTLPNDPKRMYIMFENCIFDSCVHGAAIGEGTKAFFLNCHFIDNSYTGFGCIRGQVNVAASTFTNNNVGIEVHDKTSSCYINYCSILNSTDDGIFVKDDGKAALLNSRISNAVECAVNVECAYLRALNCDFEGSRCGIVVNGKLCNVKAQKCTVAHNKAYGFAASIECVGEITLDDCNIHSNKKNIDNSGLSKCKVVVNGTIFPTNGESAGLYKSDPSKFSEVIEDGSSPASTLTTQRDLKSAGLLDKAPTCGHCSNREPPGKRFDKCSVCRGVVYCTKECQVPSNFSKVYVILFNAFTGMCLVGIGLEEA